MVRKFSILLVILFIAAMLALPVSAAAGAELVSTTAMVNSDGSCHVSMAVTLVGDGSNENVYFPLPAGASGIRVNGSRVLASKSGDALQVNLKKYVKNVTGEVSVNIQYDLYGLVTETQIGTLELQLPLLSGFGYPIEALEFTVTLPGMAEQLPAFTSGYHQSSIEVDFQDRVREIYLIAASDEIQEFIDFHNDDGNLDMPGMNEVPTKCPSTTLSPSVVFTMYPPTICWIPSPIPGESKNEVPYKHQNPLFLSKQRVLRLSKKRCHSEPVRHISR